MTSTIQVKQMKRAIGMVKDMIDNGRLASALCSSESIRKVILRNMTTSEGETAILAKKLVYSVRIDIDPAYYDNALQIEFNNFLREFAKNMDICISHIVKNHGLNVEDYIIQSYICGADIKFQA